MSITRQFFFDGDRSDAIFAIDSITAGKGWCNVVPRVADDVPDIRVKFAGLWVSHGATEATLVTSAPKRGIAQPSMLGVLHTRGRLGKDRIRTLLDGAPFVIRQDHSQRGLLLEVPVDTPSENILEVMCSVTETLCDVEMTGGWRFDLYERQPSKA